MGALAESLRMIRLSGALFLDAEMPSQWCYLSPTPQSLREELVPGKAVLAFHVVAHGSCIASLPGREPIEVGPGELLLFPRGEQHILASSLDAFASLRPRQVQCDALRSAASALRRNAAGPTRLICGYVACGSANAADAFTDLPGLLRVSGDEQFSEWLLASVKYCQKWGPDRSGFTDVAERIVELMLLEAVRQHWTEVGAAPNRRTSPAGSDRLLQRALALVHGHPSRAWTVEELAAKVGLSRSALAARFVQHLGEPPKHYLARWRMALASDALLSTADTVVQIAHNVGYDSEAAFSRAFKRVYGMPPAQWRKGAATAARLLKRP
jgi:AraC-like DNA-binding protein